MLLWYAVYKNKPQEETHTEERAPRADVLKRFDDTVKMAEMHHGCAVIGMWLIDEATEQGDVVRIYGAVPIEIRTRHEAYLARTTATNKKEPRPSLAGLLFAPRARGDKRDGAASIRSHVCLACGRRSPNLGGSSELRLYDSKPLAQEKAPPGAGPN